VPPRPDPAAPVPTPAVEAPPRPDPAAPCPPFESALGGLSVPYDMHPPISTPITATRMSVPRTWPPISGATARNGSTSSRRQPRMAPRVRQPATLPQRAWIPPLPGRRGTHSPKLRVLATPPLHPCWISFRRAHVARPGRQKCNRRSVIARARVDHASPRGRAGPARARPRHHQHRARRYCQRCRTRAGRVSASRLTACSARDRSPE